MDPEFMQKMNTLKWSKDEQFIQTPEYETRKRVLFNNHFGDPASLAGAKPPKKKTSTSTPAPWTGTSRSQPLRARTSYSFHPAKKSTPKGNERRRQLQNESRCLRSQPARGLKISYGHTSSLACAWS